MYKKISRLGYTLTELIIAISISAIVLIIIFFFVTDTLIQLSETDKNSRFLNDFSRFSAQFHAQSTTFSDAEVLIDNTSSGGYDVILLKDISGQNGILWGVVDHGSLQLVPNSDFGEYKDVVLGYRLVSSGELAELATTPAEAYNYSFFGDKVFTDFKVKDLQADFFNGGEIISMDMGVVTQYEEEKQGILWKDLSKEFIFDVNLNF